MNPENNARVESTQTKKDSVLKYHMTKLKTDGTIIAGAILSVASTLLALILLHENWNGMWVVPVTVLGLTAFLVPVTMCVRELFRRRQTQNKQQSTFTINAHPLAVFAASMVFGLLLTAGVSKTALESGVYYQMGQRQLAHQDYLAAAESYSRFISLAPGQSVGYYKRGLSLYKAGQLDQAYADLKVAIERQPRDWNTRVLFLGTLERLGRSDELKTELERAELLNPNARRSLNEFLDSVEG